MLFYYFNEVCKSVLIFLLFILICAGYTYAANLRRKADDPKKRDYHPFAIIMAPFMFLFFASLGLFVLILRALLFAGFLIVFTILLIALRKPFLFEWWHKFATKVGDPLLKVNTRLIKLAIGS